MMQCFSYLSIVRSILPLCIALLSVTSFTLSIHAQKFRPIPVLFSCNAFVEGRGLYVFGGIPATGALASEEAFMLDLSVPWNASDPVFKKLVYAIGASPLLFTSCTLLPNGEDILQVVYGTVYLYNTVSASWRTASHNMLPYLPAIPAADPESGLVYVIQNGGDPATNGTMHAIDLKTQTTNSLMIPGLSNLGIFNEAAWSTHLKSVLVTSTIPNAIYVFTPSKVSESSHGWRLQNTKGDPMTFGVKSCFLPLGDGSKMAFVGTTKDDSSIMRILDVATWTWTTRTTIPHPGSNACAISGDQFIVWGSYENFTLSDTTAVYNMKTDKWVTNYIAPTTTTVPSSTSRAPIQNTPTAISEPGDTASSEKKLVIIIIVVTGGLLAIILTIIAVYLGITKRSRTDDTLSTGSDDTTSDCEEVSSDSLKKQKLYKSILSGRFHLEPFGARSLPEQPHAMVKDPLTKRNAQEGAIEAELVSQHPHAVMEEEMANRHEQKGAFAIEMYSQHPYAMAKEELAKRNAEKGAFAMELVPQHPHAVVEEGLFTAYHSKAKLEPTRNWGDKAELE